jgi:uncharacterized protein (DUF608 family)
MVSPIGLSFRYNQLEHLSWPLGGVGAALFGLTGTGGLDRISNRHRPDVRGLSSMFAALSFPGRPEMARVLEGQVQQYKVWTNGLPALGTEDTCARGHTGGFHHGYPRLNDAVFIHRFPFAEIEMREARWPVEVSLRAWSPFIPGDEDASGLPVAALTYRLRNAGTKPIQAVFSYHFRREVLRERTMGGEGETIRRTKYGVAVDYAATAAVPSAAGGISVEIDRAKADCAWFRGGWYDARTILWRNISEGNMIERGPHANGNVGDGASLWLPIDLEANAELAVTVRLAWYEPLSDQRIAMETAAPGTYRPHYATSYPSVDAVAETFRSRLTELEGRTAAFAEALHTTDVPKEALEAVTANLGILRSPTVMRQHDGRLWCWEGCQDLAGSCQGSCTHVWNYAQATAHLFPNLERSLRETEFIENQDEWGHQSFRAALPIGPTDHNFHAAADGQLGGIIKTWREWQISGDGVWLRRLWPRVRSSLNYCIETWDPDRAGTLIEPHHNTYDIEFWGADGMCESIYAGALKAGIEMATEMGEEAEEWRLLLKKAVAHLDGELFRDGRYIQQVRRSKRQEGEVATLPIGAGKSPEAESLIAAEGPKYQYGSGCLSDGVFGAWLAEACGLGSPMDAEKVRSHLRQIHRHNLRKDLRQHCNPQRPTFAMGAEGGLLLCTWPEGGKPTLPFVYSDEVWTGIEYQVASHCMFRGLVEEGLEIVRVARSRYDGQRRNPFDEYECGHWYGRALASWALLHALSGVRYSAAQRTLWMEPRSAQRPYRAYLGVGGNFGTVTLEAAGISVALAAGSLEIERVVVSGKEHAWRICAEAGSVKRLTW